MLFCSAPLSSFESGAIQVSYCDCDCDCDYLSSIVVEYYYLIILKKLSLESEPSDSADRSDR